ncbi:hypothetical protein SLS56_002152 [Neofusicoccum ribis]|uniref:Serine hydrolase domain-containing protein n=1 Tax=Neofusicoccum ribis TaxID=45134 RepID=A0ABR3T5B0_9PEZI
MRVLCLHGQGTNSRILRAQTESFRRLLPDHYEFFYLDGAYECGPGEGVAGVFPGPYRCYYPMPPTQGSLRQAHELVLDAVDRDGPFDVVLGFSQRNHKGRSHDADTDADADPPLFRAAVFLCASQPFSISPRAGLDCSADFDLTAAATTISAGAISRSVDDGSSSDSSSPTASSSEDEDVEGNVDATVRRFDPSHDPHRIGIPTAHVLGKLDRWAPQGRKLVDLCAEGTALLFAHRLGHVVPRDAAASAAIAEVVERVAVGM